MARLSLLGELATTIVHEVNQPLAAIAVDAETSLILLAQAELDVAKLRKITERLADSARRGGDIILRVREMAAADQMEKTHVNLNELIFEALQLVRHKMEAASIAVATTLDPRLPCVIGDHVQLEQVMVNLLLNAVQALEQKRRSSPCIELRTHFDGGRSLVCIRDNGTGIAEDEVQHIFKNRFTTKRGGLGLGLTICRSILTAHGGEIDVRNSPDGGAEFEFWIPVPTAVKSSGSGKISDSST